MPDLNAESIVALREMYTQHQEMYQAFRRGSGQDNGYHILQTWMGEVDGTISAANGSTVGTSTMGSGTVKLLYKDDTHKFQYQRNSANEIIEVTAYNWTEEASASGALVVVGQTPSGMWLFLNEAC